MHAKMIYLLQYGVTGRFPTHSLIFGSFKTFSKTAFMTGYLLDKSTLSMFSKFLIKCVTTKSIQVKELPTKNPPSSSFAMTDRHPRNFSVFSIAVLTDSAFLPSSFSKNIGLHAKHNNGQLTFSLLHANHLV